jgi:hypothetical protein
MPFPSEETTPPVTNMYCVMVKTLGRHAKKSKL